MNEHMLKITGFRVKKARLLKNIITGHTNCHDKCCLFSGMRRVLKSRSENEGPLVSFLHTQ